MKRFREVYIPPLFYRLLAGLATLFITGFFLDPLLLAAEIAAGIFLLLLLTDIFLVYGRKGRLLLVRELPDRFSNGDENDVYLFIQNQYPFPVKVSIYDELPARFQLRDFQMNLNLKAFEEKRLHYTLRPTTRGEYEFGQTNIFYTSPVGIIGRMKKFGDASVIIPVYPSFLRMHKYELLAISNRLSEVGIKRVRRIGTHSEFDQIKDYVKGDNYRTINWKATAKNNKLMVNQYQEERSQNVYNVIDKGRLMQLPFNGMALLDYAINSSLILSNICLQKHDKAGLVTFNKNVDTFMKAERKNESLPRILEHLYNQHTDYYESDYALLTAKINRIISHRSLIVLYTNFETLSSLERHMKYFRSIAKKHVLLVVIFQNEEIRDLSSRQAGTLEEVYVQTIANKHTHDKKQIVKELMKNGIFSVLTRPEDLSAGLINKYLELKDTGRF